MIALAPADTLICDTASIAAWQADPAYDYNRELVAANVDLTKMLVNWVGKILSKLFGSAFAAEYTVAVLVGIAVLLLLAVLWFIYKKRPELFMRSRKNPLAYSVHSDTIYGVDFQEEIAAALTRGDYREAVRLLYLQSLKLLSDEGRIDWQPYKTPTEYIYEMKAEVLRVPFRKLTNGFLRVRYGNFDATEPTFREMQTWWAEIEKGGLQ